MHLPKVAVSAEGYSSTGRKQGVMKRLPHPAACAFIILKPNVEGL
jgi:hypothetical protein